MRALDRVALLLTLAAQACLTQTPVPEPASPPGRDAGGGGPLDTGGERPDLGPAECDAGGERACGQDEGACRQGLQACEGGHWGACVGGVEPSDERCDGADNDCDGNTDEGFADADDPENCGACGRVCPQGPRVAGITCVGGRCVHRCEGGYGDCDDSLEKGCETDVRSTVDHCGRCDSTCDLDHVAFARCANSICQIAGCDGGWGDCDREAETGCEASFLDDPAHCGACNRTCAPGTNVTATECADFQCRALACAPDFGDCDGDFGNGCERDLRSAVQHCGECRHACAPDPEHAATVVELRCRERTCHIERCAADRHDVDGQVATGCEYACRRQNQGREICDGVDDDCDGQGDAADCIFDDLSEAPDGTWRGLAGDVVCDQADVAVQTSRSQLRLDGEWSVHLRTTGAGGAWAVFPGARDAALDLAGATHLRFRARGDGDSQWSSGSPQVRLFWGGLDEPDSYTDYTMVPPATYVEDQWQDWTVPLDAPPAEPGATWIRSGLAPSERPDQRVRALYVGGDSSVCGFQLFLDGIRFIRIE